ncbi:MAG: hypothetical protein ACWA5L_02120 [bacterium]
MKYQPGQPGLFIVQRASLAIGLILALLAFLAFADSSLLNVKFLESVHSQVWQFSYAAAASILVSLAAFFAPPVIAIRKINSYISMAAILALASVIYIIVPDSWLFIAIVMAIGAAMLLSSILGRWIGLICLLFPFMFYVIFFAYIGHAVTPSAAQISFMAQSMIVSVFCLTLYGSFLARIVTHDFGIRLASAAATNAHFRFIIMMFLAMIFIANLISPEQTGALSGNDIILYSGISLLGAQILFTATISLLHPEEYIEKVMIPARDQAVMTVMNIFRPLNPMILNTALAIVIIIIMALTMGAKDGALPPLIRFSEIGISLLVMFAITALITMSLRVAALILLVLGLAITMTLLALTFVMGPIDVQLLPLLIGYGITLYVALTWREIINKETIVRRVFVNVFAITLPTILFAYLQIVVILAGLSIYSAHWRPFVITNLLEITILTGLLILILPMGMSVMAKLKL